MAALKPCPFCGGEAHVLKDGLPYVVIECGHCFGRTNCNVTEKEAVKAWNTRAERTCENVSEYCNEFYCSNCGCEFDFITDNDAMRGGRPKYCPHCGAKVVS